MTDEEVGKMALKYAETINLNNVNISIRNHIKYAFIVGYNACKQQIEAKNNELKQQIEKMKCCGNCKYCSLDAYRQKPCCYCKGKDKWEKLV